MKWFCKLLFLLSLAGVASPLCAQEEEPLILDDETFEAEHFSDIEDSSSLDILVITATRSATDPFEVPYTVSVIPEEEIELKQYRNLTEALVEIPGVSVQKTANGQGSPFIRGFTGYRTLSMIDGVRFNNSVYRDGPNEYFSLIDLEAIKTIELVQGPGSILYGSDAIGGTLNLLTKSSNYLEEAEGEVFHHGSVGYRWASAERSHGTRLDYQTGVGGKWGLHLGGSLRNYGDVEAADLGRQPFTGYDEWAYDARFDYSLNDQWTFTLAHQQLAQDDVWRTHSTIYARSFAGSEVGSDLRRLKDQRRNLTYAKLSGTDLDGFVDAVTLTASYQKFSERGDRIRSNERRQLDGFDAGMWGLDLQLESETPIGTLVYGADYYEDHVDSFRSDFNADGSLRQRRVQGPIGDDSVFGQFGAYIQDDIHLGDRVELLLGGRYNQVSADIGRFQDPVNGGADSFSDTYESLVGSARLSYDLDEAERYRVFAGISQSFRAPNVGDLSRFGGSRSDEIESAATGLEPEEFLTYELGLKARAGRTEASVTYFYTELENFITSTPTGRIVDGLREVTKQNSAKGFVQGVEARLDYDLGAGFSIFGNIAWVEGEADTFLDPANKTPVREPLSRIQPIIGTGGFRWEREDGRLWAELSLTVAQKADRLNTADRGDTQRIPPNGTPGYELLNFYAGYELKEDLTLYGGVENILDEAYRSHGSGANEPGIGVNLGVKYEF